MDVRRPIFVLMIYHRAKAAMVHCSRKFTGFRFEKALRLHAVPLSWLLYIYGFYRHQVEATKKHLLSK